MRWYINRTGTAEGPWDEQTILGMIGRGEVQPHHQICAEGQQAWQALTSHPPFAYAGQAPVAQVGAAAHQVAGGFEQAAHQVSNDFGGTANQVANQFGGAANALAGAASTGQAPSFAANAAPGEGFFEQARARNEPISEEAKKAASMAHLLAAGGALLGCWFCGLGGVIGAFVGNVLYKEQPKSPFALFHINQALQMQIVLWVTNVALAIVFNIIRFIGAMIADILGLILSGLTLINLALFLVAVILPFLQSGKAKAGEWSMYPKIGERVMRAKSPMLK